MPDAQPAAAGSTEPDTGPIPIVAPDAVVTTLPVAFTAPAPTAPNGPGDGPAGGPAGGPRGGTGGGSVAPATGSLTIDRPGPGSPGGGAGRAPSKRELRRITGRRRSPWRGPVWWSLTMAAVGLAAITGFSLAEPERRQTASAAVLVAASAAVFGALIGLLFGAPRRPGTPARPSDQEASEPAGTALEQVGDWLGKILIGIALTQFTGIVRWAGRLFDQLGPMLGTGRTAVVFAGGLVVFHLGSGFITGWLFGRLLLRGPDGVLDRRVTTLALMDAANRAERLGDPDTAAHLREQARTQLTGITAAPALRPAGRDTCSGPPRDRRLEELMAEARTTARSLRLDPDDVASMLRDGGDGQRATALAFMQTKQELTDIEALATVLTRPRTAFEQHQALALAVQVLPYLGDPDAERLRGAARYSTLDVGVDTSRIALRSQLLG